MITHVPLDIIVFILNAGEVSYEFVWNTATALLLTCKTMADAVRAWRRTVADISFLMPCYDFMFDSVAEYVTWIKHSRCTNCKDAYKDQHYYCGYCMDVLKEPCEKTWVKENVAMFEQEKELCLLYGARVRQFTSATTFALRGPWIAYSEKFLNVIIMNAPRLRTLKLIPYEEHHSPYISSCIFATLTARECTLRHVELRVPSKLPKDVLLKFIDSQPKLETLRLSTWACAGEVYEHVAANCHKLTSLVIDAEFSMVTSNLLGALARGCPDLNVLWLDGMFAVTDTAVEQYASTHPQLSEFKITCNDKVTDRAVIALGRTCPLLRKVAFVRCSHVTDAAIKALATGCPLMEDVDVSYCLELTDASISALTTCSSLRKLNIKGCGFIDVVPIVEHCTRLNELTFEHCSDLKIEDLQHYCLVNALNTTLNGPQKSLRYYD